MQMNTAIPFSGVQPDFVNALAMGQQAAMQRNEASRINALAGLYQTQGADILAGNQGALNALAGIDPMAALGVADARQGMDARALQMDATRQDMRQQAEQWAAQLDERERAQRLAEGQAFLGQLVAVDGNPQAFDALMIQTGKPELVGQYNMLPQLIDNMRDPLDALAMYDQRNAARQEVKVDSKAPAEFNADQFRVVDGVGLVNLAAPGGPAVVNFPGQAPAPGLTADQLGDANTLRDDLTRELTDFQLSRSGWENISTFFESPGSVSDYALAVAFAKILDPTSVAREGEVAAVAASGSIPAALQSLLTNAINGTGKLPPEVRAEIANLAAQLYNQRADRAQGIIKNYGNIARSAGIPVSAIYTGGPINPVVPPTVPTGDTLPPPVDQAAPPPSTVPPPGPQPTFAIPQPAQVSTWTDAELTNFLTQSTAQGVQLPPEVWDAIMARTMQLNEQAQQ